MKVTLKVLNKFFDMQAGRLRQKNEQFTTDIERAKHIQKEIKGYTQIEKIER